MKNAIKKTLDRILRKQKLLRTQPPIDVTQAVVDLANADKSIDSAYSIKTDATEKLAQVLKTRPTRVIVVPASPDGLEVFVVYTRTSYYPGTAPIELVQLARVKLEAV